MSVDFVGYSPNLASAVSFRIFSYYGERRPSGGARALLTSLLHPSLGPDHPPPWVWSTLRAVEVTGSWDSGVLGPALTSIPCPRSSFSTWLHSSLSFTEDWRGRPCISQSGPPHPSMLGGWLREGWPHDQGHTAGSHKPRALRPQLQSDLTTLHPQAPAASHPREDPGHSTILASVLISARTQSGQSRSPQNRNLCTRVRQVVRLGG